MEDPCSFTLDAEALETLDESVGGSECNIDRFASSVNRRAGMEFNSRFYQPDSVAVDAFTQDWGGKADNWLHPPWGLIGHTVKHLRKCRGKGTIVVPLDTRQPWWPLLAVGAAGGVWRRGSPVRVELNPKDGGTDGEAVLAARPLLGIRLDFSGVKETRPTAPGLRRRLQSRVAEQLRGA